jgi:hypothetical protein
MPTNDAIFYSRGTRQRGLSGWQPRRGARGARERNQPEAAYFLVEGGETHWLHLLRSRRRGNSAKAQRTDVPPRWMRQSTIVPALTLDESEARLVRINQARLEQARRSRQPVRPGLQAGPAASVRSLAKALDCRGQGGLSGAAPGHPAFNHKSSLGSPITVPPCRA